MSGSLILSLFGGSSASTDMLSIIEGNGGSATPALSSNPVTALQIAQTTQTQAVAKEAKVPQVSRDVAAFTKAVLAAKTPADLLKNPTVMKVLLTANGLADQLGYPALAQKALLSNVSDPKSLANQLTDSRWKAAAQTYSFATKGLSVIQNPSTISTIANGYAEVLWRQSLDAGTPGLSNALSFRQSASTITSVDQILGDPILRNVVTTALGIPQEIAFQDIGAQEKAISSRIDITKFKDPKFVDTFTQRYLMAASQSASTSQPTDLTSLAAQAASLFA